MQRLALDSLPSPCYVVDRAAIERNLQIIQPVQRDGGARVLLALKGLATWSLFPLVRQYLDGVAVSSLHEAQLGKEEFGGHVHLYAPAYRHDEFDQLMMLVDCVTFNSFSQWRRFKRRAQNVPCALRINPQHSEVKTALYDPCAPFSRFGVTADHFEENADELDGIAGLHFHTLSGLGADALQRTLEAVEEKFGRFLDRFQWINLGGGHRISGRDYDVDLLIDLVAQLRQRHGLEVYLEPAEAIALDAGVLVATVLDVVKNEIDIAILDTSATAHMPDVLEMPYRPSIVGAGTCGEKAHAYRLGGPTCLAGDIIGDYSFDRPLRVGDRLVFADMAHYTMVKNTTFNGVCLPAIAIHNSATGQTHVVRKFGYEDYKGRLS